MANMKRVRRVCITQLRPYEKNAKKHSKKQIEQIAASIQEYGFLTPVLIDSENRVIAGHGRIEAAKLLGMDRVPCVPVEGLTEAQRKGYTLADNRLTELGSWDRLMVAEELEWLQGDGFDIDLTGFSVEDLDIPDPEDGWYGDERERTNRAYNLDIAQGTERTNDFWQMPILQPCTHVPDELIGFNYAKTSDRKDVGVHFYVDDYQFERVWNAPEKYTDILAEYDCILTPDFSLYMDMPMPMKIWNVYRSRQIGAYYQRQGLRVIPTLSWAEEETFEFCFLGIPKGSVVSVSTVGVKRSDEATEIWTAGMAEAIKQLEPSTVLEYGGDIGFDYGGISVRRYSNQVTETWHESKSVEK